VAGASGGDGLEWGTTWAGAAVGLVPAGAPQTAAAVTQEVMREAANALRRRFSCIRAAPSA